MKELYLDKKEKLCFGACNNIARNLLLFIDLKTFGSIYLIKGNTDS